MVEGKQFLLINMIIRFRGRGGGRGGRGGRDYESERPLSVEDQILRWGFKLTIRPIFSEPSAFLAGSIKVNSLILFNYIYQADVL